MQKLKFGIQITALILAFPLWFLAEMKQADQDMKKTQTDKQEVINPKKAEEPEAQKKSMVSSEVSMLPATQLMVVNI